MNEGDIFRWSWKKDSPRREQCKGTGTLYWCMSRIAVCRNGRLTDTYWSSGEKVIDVGEVDLTFIANFDGLEKIDEWKALYYSEKDIVNLNHSNSSRDNIYRRKNSQKCPERIREHLQRKIEDANHEIDCQKRVITRAEEQLALLESGKIDDVYI